MELLGLFGAAGGGAAAAGTGVTAAGLGSGAIGTGLTATELSAAVVPGVSTLSATGVPWGAVLTGGLAGSSLLGGLSGFQSGQANAAFLSESAKQSLGAGAANKSIAEARSRAQLGELRAQMGAQGTTMSGSPMLVYLDSVKNAALESANEYYSGALRSAGLKSQARISRLGGQADLFKGFVGAGGSLLLR